MRCICRSQETGGARKGRSPQQMRKLSIIAVLSLLALALAATAALATDSTSFKMLRSQTAVANDCLEGARAHVDVKTTVTDQQIMDVTVANAPFGISWYQADFDTNDNGFGEVRARGIFSEELFAVAPGSVPAPQVDDLDADTNPAFAPVHTYHVGLWFGSPEEAAAAGCPETVTPFDGGGHQAGVQAFSTRNFGALHGPLRSIE